MEKFEYFIKEIHPSDFFNSEIDIIKNLKKKFKELKFISKGDKLIIEGQSDEIIKVCVILDNLIYFIKKNENINESNIIEILNGNGDKLLQSENGRVILYGVNKKKIKAHTLNQIKLVESFERNDMVFAIGPAGTGKTYTGIAIAVKALKSKIVKRIILTRPAVEAGENLGFLPGDVQQKVDPYLRPLFDSLHSIFGIEKTNSLIDKGIIEVVPLAFMRGRTLDDSLVILDEAQNTTISQMRMFLTRLGERSKMVVNGDITQIDLKDGQESGLVEASKLFVNIDDIKICYLKIEDVVRHPLVQKIIEIYN